MTDGTKRIVGLYWLAIALGGLSAAYAVFCARDLVYDGSYELLGTAAHSTFQLSGYARAVPQALQQCFAIAGERAGVHDLFALARLMSLGMSGWPILLTAGCWFVLPRDEKIWIIGPLLNLVLVIPTTNFIGVGEGIIASCLLWLLFLTFAFRMHSTPGAIATIILTVTGGFTSETAFPFMAGLSLFAAIRARRASGWEKAALIVIALLAAVGSLHLLSWIVFPRDAIERSDFLFANLRGEFVGTVREPNLPVLASTAAAVAIAGTWIRGKTFSIGDWSVWAAFALFAFIVALIILFPDQMISPWRNFAARGLPVMFTTFAALGIFLMRQHRISLARYATVPAARILLGLMLTQTALQFAMTERWQAFTDDMRGLLSQHRGTISFTESSRALNPSVTRLRWELLMAWAVQPLSIVLAPGGHVVAVVQPGPKAHWFPYRFDVPPAAYPKAPGLDWSHFPLP